MPWSFQVIPSNAKLDKRHALLKMHQQRISNAATIAQLALQHHASKAFACIAQGSASACVKLQMKRVNCSTVYVCVSGIFSNSPQNISLISFLSKCQQAKRLSVFLLTAFSKNLLPLLYSLY